MESVEKRALSAYQSPIPFWKRYVDDTVTALPWDSIKNFHSHLNSFKNIHPVHSWRKDRQHPFIPGHKDHPPWGYWDHWDPNVLLTTRRTSPVQMTSHWSEWRTQLSTTENWCSLQDPLWRLPQKLHYHSQTSKTLKYRLTEPKRALRSGEAAQSAVAEHAMKEDHTIKWEEADMVDHDPRYCQRCTLEAWHIRAEQQKMNRDDGSLPVVHNPLIYMSHCPHTPSWLLDYNSLLIVVNPQLWRIGDRGKGPETGLELGTYALSWIFSHASDQSRLRSFVPNRPLVLVMGVPLYPVAT